MASERWAAGVDLGGTKIQIIQVNAFGTLGERVRCQTDVAGGAKAIENDIAEAVKSLAKRVGSAPLAIGIGVAGQIQVKTGVVVFGPNLKWHNVPFQQSLTRLLGIPVIVINDVRAATWGEWLHGAGKGCSDLACIFVGTGVGGGIVMDNKVVNGHSNTAGEIGHMIVEIGGPPCTCGANGCVEAFAGGWALTKRAQQLAKKDPHAASAMIKLAGGDHRAITGKEVAEAFKKGDTAATEIIKDAIRALGASTAALVNAVNPQKIIFGGGVIEGSPELIHLIEEQVRINALSAACQDLEMVRASLHNDAGAIGAGALALRSFK